MQRPELQAFVGVLYGAQTSREVFVTTARSSSGARQFADQVPMRLVLIDSTELIRVMVCYLRRTGGQGDLSAEVSGRRLL